MKMTRYTLALLLAASLASCTPDAYEVLEMKSVDVNNVASIQLQANHYMLLADGRAQVEFRPVLTTKEGYQVLDSRIDPAVIEYTTSTGSKIAQAFSTADKSLVGKTLEIRANLVGTTLTSNPVQVTVVDPAPAAAFTEMTLPVVFHLMQTETEISDFAGEISAEKIYQVLDKINNTFGGKVSLNATGVDSKIRFKAAEYDPEGKKMLEPGIHRVYVSEVSDSGKDLYNSFIKNKNALWDAEKYLNIWLISDRGNSEYGYFFNSVSTTCRPKYSLDGAQAPQGLSLEALPAAWSPLPTEVGVVYRLSSILTMVRTWGAKNENELVTALGHYLGLLPTWAASGAAPDDYCTDTHGYAGDDANGYQDNETPYKLVGDNYFLAENIMDDPTGVHRSLSLQQAQRARWTLTHCAGRQAWKSGFAFSGK